MGERKGVNKYYPPDWDPSKGSINEYVGQHPLRDRARKLGQGILIIRFEMPYNIWCGGCNSHIGMGVRYNAEKLKTGMYYTTPIYKFRMKCHLCDNHFEIQTDPKNHDYVILDGARRKEQRWDPTENGQIATEDKAVQKKMATDAMFKLEHGSDDIQKGKKAISNLGSLEVRRDEWKDDYMLNRLARQKFREEKKALKVEAESDSALLVKSSLDIPLEKEAEEDIKLAGLIKYRTLESYDEKQAQKRKEIESRPLFETAKKVAKVEVKSPEDKKFDIIRKTLKTARDNCQISPFDRTKMNTLGSTISKESLGIRKKCLPKFSAKPNDEENCAVKSLQSSGNSQDYCEEPVCGNHLKNGRTCDIQEPSYYSEDSEKNIGSEDFICTLCGKKLNQEQGDVPEQGSSALCTCKYETVAENNVSHGSGTSADVGSASGKKEVYSVKDLRSCIVDADNMKSSQKQSNDQQDFKTSGLGLVCSYSDMDSDAST